MPPNPVRVEERLIVALDYANPAEAKQLVETLGDAVLFYKIGLELAMAPGYFELLDWLLARDKKVFCDLKFYDVPATVGAAVRNIAKTGAHLVTVHGDRSVMAAANEAKAGHLQVFAVTVLTSMDNDDLRDLGGNGNVADVAEARACIARDMGCDGVICSGQEVSRIKMASGGGLLAITPGIRLADYAGGDDQKRVVSPSLAIANGADYLVVGRPIRQAASPRAVAEQIQSEIASAAG